MGLSAFFFLFYIFVVGCIGYLSSKKATEEDFMIAGRRVAGSQLAATMSAGFFDGATLGVYLAYIYQFGLSAIWLFIGFGFGFLPFPLPILISRRWEPVTLSPSLQSAYSRPS